MNTLHLTQQFASVSLFFYGLILNFSSITKRNKFISYLIILLSVFIHSWTLIVIPFIFLRRYKFRFWYLLIVIPIVFLIFNPNIIDLFIYALEFLPQSSYLSQAVSQKITGVIIESGNNDFALPTLAYFEASILLFLGIANYKKLPELIQVLFNALFICFLFVVIFSDYPIFSLRYYVFFQFLKIFIYSFLFFEYKPLKKVIQPLGYIILAYSIFSFYFNFDKAPFSFKGIYSLELLTMNIVEIISNITY